LVLLSATAATTPPSEDCLVLLSTAATATAAASEDCFVLLLLALSSDRLLASAG
jgi:hypothetical protein